MMVLARYPRPPISQVQTHTGIKDGLFETQDRDFPHIFCTTTQEELEISSESKEQQGCGFFDFVDGRIFFLFLKSTRDDARSLLESFSMGVFYMWKRPKD
ncbi:hypothetical protein BFJ63_vAg7328 [Fusarium oxysporum f. sp. narcissi]|uniref:Uncharacterized protein n=1 Tax=Fusarium oxysporum f. sp. narcissi TaxID=451672 RepID=A0A4Q2VSX4_FUSOX|nr:uncharacterized protein FOBCDRAFT_223513 [Fusarium oxysporum Fo47]RYC89850.1 hypothetical protein BFJ63_vAg7328 [Fusarium oxysporum f. sp. narcissi]WJG35335.1 hypothetical protein FOBCDRAFT_223513 [Fusarium oxysporum Fo47]